MGQEKPSTNPFEISRLKSEAGIHKITSHVCICETTTVVIAERRIFDALEA